ncbi:hypothetical protein TNCV_3933831 [Trichonephila clavipes]|nr:hypothetical protein TNCV_3933831 [Trichonephila clavipes]
MVPFRLTRIKQVLIEINPTQGGGMTSLLIPRNYPEVALALECKYVEVRKGIKKQREGNCIFARQPAKGRYFRDISDQNAGNDYVVTSDMQVLDLVCVV